MNIYPFFSDCYKFQNFFSLDQRGWFCKTFSVSTQNFLTQKHFSFNPIESFVTCSDIGVIRGLHFQVPPFESNKLVSVLQGNIFDVVCDLRVTSPTFLHTHTLTLSSGDSVYLQPGIAHGFASLAPNTLVSYMTNAPYSSEHDHGILWSSIDVDWPFDDPVVSDRDSLFPPIHKYSSPFL